MDAGWSAGKEDVVEDSGNRERVEKAFRDWQDGTGYITELLADDLRWTIVGRSRASGTYEGKGAFVGEVLEPFGARFSERFRPVVVRGIYGDGDTVVVHWDGEGTRLDGKPYLREHLRLVHAVPPRAGCGGDRLLRFHSVQRAVG
jgi:ketosteroid isomerase-like protein